MLFHFLWWFLCVFIASTYATGPFLLNVNATHNIIGNDIWNITVGPVYGTNLYYKQQDIVGSAAGHYSGWGGRNNFQWTSVSVYTQNDQYLDVLFSSNETDFHWVIFPELAGAYQYLVNKALPVVGEVRSIFRLDPSFFSKGKTATKDELLPTLADIRSAKKVQDETFQTASGTYITKYDFADYIRNQKYYGVYGPGFGSWYIHPGKDEFNGDHLKQCLMVHRESSTGDVVMLNMLHDTHFQASASDDFPAGKTWGPWLWYLNDGTLSDVEAMAEKQNTIWPYSFMQSAGYQARGSVSGHITLSDGRPAAGAAVFLGDNHPSKPTLEQGLDNYYTTYADKEGNFHFTKVRAGTYGLQAWSDGGIIRDVTTTYLQNDVIVTASKETQLGSLEWKTQCRQPIFQIGDFDRKALGFKFGGAPRQHGLIADSSANLTFYPFLSPISSWYYGQSALGIWTIAFNLWRPVVDVETSAAVLSVSLAAYSSGSSSNIKVNGFTVGNLTSGDIPSDPSVYRSGTTSGSWHYFEFPVKAGTLKEGHNTVQFEVTKYSLWHGFMWDSIILEWA